MVKIDLIANNKDEFVEAIEKLKKESKLFSKILKNIKKCIKEVKINKIFENYRKFYLE